VERSDSIEKVETPIRPAATVILVRDGSLGLEVLVQRRSSAMVFAPGAYAFPGGAVDPEDEQHGDAFRNAAVRELHEEAGVRVDPADLHPWARWVTPPGRTRRFDTWFFIAVAPDDAQVTSVADDEVDLHAWVQPADLIALYESDEVTMLPPTLITLGELSGFATVAELIAASIKREPPFFDGATMRMV
jgi:8-oxo-dGTP pyrophosphatase MutT (NUDIX family)